MLSFYKPQSKKLRVAPVNAAPILSLFVDETNDLSKKPTNEIIEAVQRFFQNNTNHNGSEVIRIDSWTKQPLIFFLLERYLDSSSVEQASIQLLIHDMLIRFSNSRKAFYGGRTIFYWCVERNLLSLLQDFSPSQAELLEESGRRAQHSGGNSKIIFTNFKSMQTLESHKVKWT